MRSQVHHSPDPWKPNTKMSFTEDSTTWQGELYQYSVNGQEPRKVEWISISQKRNGRLNCWEIMIKLVAFLFTSINGASASLLDFPYHTIQGRGIALFWQCRWETSLRGCYLHLDARELSRNSNPSFMGIWVPWWSECMPLGYVHWKRLRKADQKFVQFTKTGEHDHPNDLVHQTIHITTFWVYTILWIYN